MQMDQLDTELREGEYIQWQGRTGAFSLLEPQARRTIFGKWLGTLVAGGILLALAGREDAGVGPARRHSHCTGNGRLAGGTGFGMVGSTGTALLDYQSKSHCDDAGTPDLQHGT